MYDKVTWEDPPESRGRPTFDVDAPAFRQLRENPKRWARLDEFDKNSSGQSRAARLRKTLGSEFEFTARRMDDNGKTAVYGRYVGPQQG